ncbi:PD40 domain-containing protein [candidate division WWE3 bacterium]|uniref:PD40 domain-containing protein n=1 Tax=candidate division WWE3 bacterium TaxID=2053526 RepID=A0A955LHF5_UNCKA|nr:PD40 domain-containing protein [candidate division WWE3 bacterium]
MNKRTVFQLISSTALTAMSVLVLVIVLSMYPPSEVWSQFTEIITRVSVDDSGTQGNNASTRNAIDSDGSNIAFASLSNNLVADDTNVYSDIFVFDATTDNVTRVSVDSSGSQANGASDAPSISADGRYIAFHSAASNLVASDTNGVVDVFVHDLQSGTTERVSVDSVGTQANNHSLYPSISDDGRYVVFESRATNLIAGDTNSAIDIFLHDRNTGATTRVSVDSSDTESDGHSIYAAISGDGQFVTYSSVATNLVAGDTNGVSDVFLRDLNTDTTTRISVHTDGTEADGLSTHQSIDDVGRYIAFESEATNLIDDDSNSYRDIFVRDTYLNVTQRVSVSTAGVEGDHISGDTTDNPNSRISANGQYVAFKSRASNLVTDDENGIVDVFVHDRQTGYTVRVSTDSLGNEANNASYYPSISNDGRYIGFYSYADNLVSGDTNGVGDVFVYDRDSLPPTSTPTPTSTPGASISNPATVTFTQNTSTPTEATVTTIAGDAYVRCENVTSGGTLSIQVLSSPPGQLTSGFTILPTNFDVSTSGGLACDYITLCLPYDEDEVTETSLEESALQLWHYDSGWTDVTSTVDSLNNRICGIVEDFSPFVIGVNDSVTPTPTTGATVTTGTPTPSILPDSGIARPTYIFLLGALVLLSGGIFLTKEARLKR